jgi:hypothetical protein
MPETMLTTAPEIATTYEKAKGIAKAIFNFVMAPCALAINTAANAVVLTLEAVALVIPGAVDAFADSTWQDDQEKVDPSWDGQVLNCRNCNNGGDCCIETKAPDEKPAPPSGKKPYNKKAKASCSNSSLKKIYYINGIDTEPQANCASSKSIANATCAEVISVYNRTEGIISDTRECVKNIRKTDDVTPTDAMEKIMKNHFGNPPEKPYQELNLYAHSQGGLITQEALIQYKANLKRTMTDERAEEVLKNINVKTFGTAQRGWPRGPKYERFLNVFDPVPHIIRLAQMKYKEVTYTEDTRAADLSNRHLVFKPKINPIGAHSMDKVYVKTLEKTSSKEMTHGCTVCPK